MKRLPTVAQAKEEIKSLENFVKLAEEYKEDTLEQKIIKLYAYIGSVNGVANEINAELIKQHLPLIDVSFISTTLKRKPTDPLHKILRAGYLAKGKHTRNKAAVNGFHYL